MRKWIAKGVGILLTVFWMIPLTAMAASDTSIVLTGQGNTAQVVLTLPAENREEVRSLQVSFRVSVTSGNKEQTNVSFVFDEGITSAVKEARYHMDSEMLNVYISGKQNLFEMDSLTLGTIQVSSVDGSEISAQIDVVEDSFGYVNAAFGYTQDTVASETGSVVVSDGVSLTPEETPEQKPEQKPEKEPDTTPEEIPEDESGDESGDVPTSENGTDSEKVDAQKPAIESNKTEIKNTSSVKTGDMVTKIGVYSAIGGVALVILAMVLDYINKKK